ncbi:MAG: hydrogenase expression/formation protein HypE [Cyclobacteriaceae bacterium]|nr:hydrogenase expression/formation protein HypE [Cyclobacteriaceae bacterium]
MNKLINSFSCPIPAFDFEVISLGHGSGGLLTNKLLDKSIFSLFDNDMLNSRHDGAVFDLAGPLAFSTDSFVVSPIFFPGGNIGDLAVNGTVNDLAMCGAVPKYLSLGLILEEGLKIEELWTVLVSAKEAANKAGVQIVTGDTKVVERNKGDKVFINTSGIGQVHPKARIDIQRVSTGDKIVVSGSLANHGVSVLSVREGLEFETDIISDTQPINNIVYRMLNTFGQHIHLTRDPTRGGIATVLNEIAQQSGQGIALNEKDIPIELQVQSACELLGLDPLYVANEGVYISFVAAEIADSYVEALRQCPGAKKAACIGEVVTEHPGQVIINSRIGGRRVIAMLPGEQLPRIC